ncbi:hypothetical protein AMS58_17855 [Pseudoalteromonas porphyrae]|uniref:Porin n=1 Tax=Pseudoalteromonas porphyrae TaxID=187330 RepID=A0A0N1MRS0_9GAMM|nr:MULTISPECIES: hypothetical protein [Pseudoalteromonas]KPH58650.1 hypothetical protein ADS77_17625 [Pseudoalteromonas porphyrae]KPH93351.1 hypothetical protein AMS58_17855 [Pseudoalteromonas porphyrae]
MIIKNSLGVVALVGLLSATNVNAQIKGLLHVSAVKGDSQSSWQEGGVGLYRYDSENDGVLLSQGLIDFRADLSTDWSAHGVINAYQDPEPTLGFSQAYLQYKPLTKSKYKWHVRVGGFYPLLSLENPDMGWISPYNYTNSAINSWIGEEVRTVGVEATIKRPGRSFNSAHSFAFVGATFKGNDPAGTLLAWRGFAMHDRQTTFNEGVAFAPVASLNTPQLQHQANQVLPFEEVDGRYGYYTGIHWDYLKKSQFRFYYYDNNGDPAAINYSTGQYAWDTRFSSAAWLYKFTAKTRLITQAMSGSTAMGKNRGVDNRFYSHFFLLSHKIAEHRLSIRYDYFKVTDKDDWAFDPNASHGEGITATWRYQLTPQWQLGIEGSALRSQADNRQAIGIASRISQQQVLLNAQWRF